MAYNSELATLKEIEIPSGTARTHWQEILIERGHWPGVVSLANLAGKAKKFGYSYRVTRDKVATRLARYGVSHAVVKTPLSDSSSGLARVWVDSETLQPVRLVLVD